MTEFKQNVSVLFVCMGNICRSPTAEGVFRHHVQQANLSGRIQTDSAGTHAYHVGEPPDKRAQTAAQRREIDLSDLKARRVDESDFEKFDYVIAMDEDNLSILLELCPENYRGRLALLLEFAEGIAEHEVPDPYYGGSLGFERVLDLVEEASRGLLAEIQAQMK